MADIYGLFSGRDGQIRYVGMTGGDYRDRFKEHLRGVSCGRVIPFVEMWVRRERSDCYPVECVLLERCDHVNRHDVETTWINKFPNLVNERKVYGRNVGSPPVIPAVKNYMRRFIFNSGGFRGIHWWRDYDKYAVYIGGRWLRFGDSLPGQDWDVFFSSRTDALRKRDAYLANAFYRTADIAQELDLPEFCTLLPEGCEVDYDPNLHAAECDTAFESEFAGTIA
jgi:hypothetical protein